MLSSLAKELLEQSLKTMSTEDLNGQAEKIQESNSEGAEIIEVINAELASRATPPE